jgi:phosphohistidine phosphatase
MKTLYLLRHAQAEHQFASPDRLRNLDMTGKAEATHTGEKLRSLKPLPEQIIASSASRSLQTAKIIADEIGYPIENIRERPAVYNAEEGTLLEIINDTDDKVGALMLTGHNPGITSLAQGLASNFSEAISTAGLVVIEFEADSWQEVKWRKGKLLDYILP